MAEELKACPFCGGKADLHRFTRSRYSVDCSDCDAGMTGFASESEAVAAWNSRTQVAEPTGAMVQAACAAFRLDVSPMEAMRAALCAALSTEP